MQISLFGNRGHIDQWFAKPIYVRDGFCHKENILLKKYLSEFFLFNADFKRTHELNVNTTHLVHHFDEDELFQPFIAELTKEVSLFARTIGYTFEDDNLELLNMWSNLSLRGEYLFPHCHPGSVISGAYYVEITSPDDVIKFYDNTQNMVPPANEPNRYSYEYAQYPCAENRLLLFRSDLMHGCPALVGERKIVISFNYGISS